MPPPFVPRDLTQLGWATCESKQFPNNYYFYNTRDPSTRGYWKVAQVYCHVEHQRHREQERQALLHSNSRFMLACLSVLLVALGLGLTWSSSYLGSEDKLNIISIMGVSYGCFLVIVHAIFGAWCLDSRKALWTYTIASVLVFVYMVEVMLMVSFDGVPSFMGSGFDWTETLDDWFHTAGWSVALPMLLSLVAFLHLFAICVAMWRIRVLWNLDSFGEGEQNQAALLAAPVPSAGTVSLESDAEAGRKHSFVRMVKNYGVDGVVVSDDESTATLDSATMGDFDGLRSTTRSGSGRR